MLDALWGDRAALLSQSIRGAITAPPGRCLVVCDYASVESVILGWISGCERVNNLFRTGLDAYKDFATELFHVPYDQVTKKQREYSKPPVLGAGFGLGWEGLIAYAEGYGVEMDKGAAKHAIDTFRGVYPEIPEFWKELTEMIHLVITNPLHTFSMPHLQAFMVGSDMLLIMLPSGRCLHYYQPKWEPLQTPWGETRDGFSHMGMDQYTHQWRRIPSHPGKATENVIQAIAADVMRFGLSEAEAEDIDVIGHVHDEIIAEEDLWRAEATLDNLRRIMSTSPPWAPDLLLGAAGWIGMHYRKD